MFLDPGGVGVHPGLDEGAGAVGGEAAFGGEGGVVHVEEDFGLGQGGHVEECEHVAQVLLSQGGADGSGGGAEDAGGLAAPHALAVGARAVVEGILEDAGDGAVVLGGDEDDALCGGDFGLHAQDAGGLLGVVVLVVEREVADFDDLEGEVGGGQRGEGLGKLAVDGILAQAADDDGDLGLTHGKGSFFSGSRGGRWQ